MWDRYFGKHEQGHYLTICHSQGAINVRNALEYYPEERRKRIIVLAVAPAAYISPKMCKQAHHLISENDSIPSLAAMRSREHKPLFDRNNPNVTMLPRHPKENLFNDHAFESKTYEKQTENFIKNFVKNHTK